MTGRAPRYTPADIARVAAGVDLVALIGQHVQLKRSGHEWLGCCPFHSERTPSFTVIPRKGFWFCFGCRAQGDVFGWLMQYEGVDFEAAYRSLSGDALPAQWRRPVPLEPAGPPDAVYVPLLPAPPDARQITDGVSIVLPNPKRGRPWHMKPSRADAYRNAQGQLLGYVLRVDFDNGEKQTPQVTWCISPEGECGWTVFPFPTPRPLQGLDDLAARPDAPVLVVSGEKCRAVGAQILRQLVVVTWPGGDAGVKWVDWMPLKGRRVCFWPDADRSGWLSMVGGEDPRTGKLIDGAAFHALAHRAAELHVIDPGLDPETGIAPGLPKGWDIADARAAGWSAQQIVSWMRAKERPLDFQPVDDRWAA